MRRYVLFTLCLLLLAALAGGAVVGFGLFNVSAREGHLPLVPWVLHTTYRNSVDLRAPEPAVVPDLTVEGRVQLGAAHYASACAMCHGVPGAEVSATIQSMLPMPPPINEAVRDWDPAELFWIVKNGVKMSGMPAWPSSERDDDVWPVVAFLTRVGSMNAKRYAEVLNNSGATILPADSLYEQQCQSCHGHDGVGTDTAYVPRLDILEAQYIRASLLAFRSGERYSGIMQQVASLLSDEDVAAVSEAIGELEPVSNTQPSDLEAPPPTVAKGAAIAAGESAAHDVPACVACHGPYPVERSALFPELPGQHEGYILRQLELFKSESRGGTPWAKLMHEVVPTLSPAQMKSVAAYYASLPAAATE